MKKTHPILAYLLPQPRDILFVGVFFSMVFGGTKLFNNDGDLGRHITIGNYILDTWTIPTRDIFSHTMVGERLVPHEWLAQVIFALAHRLMGLSGVELVLIRPVAFWTDGLRPQNVISEIVVTRSPTSASSEWIERLVSVRQRPDVLNRLMNGHLCFVELVPSNGCHLAALCEGLEWRVITPR